MIVQPENWREFGTPITLDKIDDALTQVVGGIDCVNLSFSGGVDSCLLLHYLLKTKRMVRVFTIANSADHPDLEYSRFAIEWFEKAHKVKIGHTVFTRPHIEGDDLVRAFYVALKPFLTSIITGDCVDELSCGYYGHQDLEEKTYYDYLRGVQAAHLQPLNDNSGDILVHIPYADNRVASLFYQIPLYERVSESERKLPIKTLAEGKVPQEIIERKKYGLGTSVR